MNIILTNSFSGINLSSKCCKCNNEITYFFPFYLGKYENAKRICIKCLKRLGL